MNWEPARADHSIDRVIATLNFSMPLDANTFDDLVVSARKAAANHNLRDRVDVADPITLPAGQNIINIGLDFQGVPARRVVFRRLDATNVPVEELSVGTRSVVFATIRYRRWANFFELLKTTITDISAECPTIQSVRSVRLEYIDRFKSTTPDADHFEAISRTSDYICAAVRDKQHALHVHSGWFDFESPQIRRLTNINVDVADVDIPPPPEPIRKITILSMAQVETLGGELWYTFITHAEEKGMSVLREAASNEEFRETIRLRLKDDPLRSFHGVVSFSCASVRELVARSDGNGRETGDRLYCVLDSDAAGRGHHADIFATTSRPGSNVSNKSTWRRQRGDLMNLMRNNFELAAQFRKGALD